MFKVSSHVLSRAILEQPDTPVRGIILFRRFFISWDGKPHDSRTLRTEGTWDLT